MAPKGYSPVRRWLREERAREMHLEDLADVARRSPRLVLRVMLNAVSHETEALLDQFFSHQDDTSTDETVYATGKIGPFTIENYRVWPSGDVHPRFVRRRVL